MFLCFGALVLVTLVWQGVGWGGSCRNSPTQAGMPTLNREVQAFSNKFYILSLLIQGLK
ncbi:hypothetical protein NG795_27660 [Laspinema sp. D3]|nr:hypothetical protein [Laspinema sp. D2c]